MTPTAISLITLSAFSHAFWNLLGKRRQPSVAFFLVANGTAAVCLIPVLIWNHQLVSQISWGVWGLIAVTGIFQAIYFSGLAAAYQRGDMSLAYPLARAVPVLLIVGVNFLMGRSYQIGAGGMVGMVLVAIGCIILPLPEFKQFRIEHYLTAVCLFALVAAVGTTGYTIVDDVALRSLRSLPQQNAGVGGTTLTYMALEALSITVMLSVVMLFRRQDRIALAQTWADHRLYAGTAGLIIVATYGLVLTSMAYVTNVSYVAAFRQLSIPIGAVLGLTIQKEKGQLPKLVGIGVVFIGLILVGLG